MTAARVTAADRLVVHLVGWMAAEGINRADWALAQSILRDVLGQATGLGGLVGVVDAARDLPGASYEARDGAVWRARRALADWHRRAAADLWDAVRAPVTP